MDERERLILELKDSDKFWGDRSDAEDLADFILARERRLLEEVRSPLAGLWTVQDGPLSKAIRKALTIIEERMGEK